MSFYGIFALLLLLVVLVMGILMISPKDLSTLSPTELAKYNTDRLTYGWVTIGAITVLVLAGIVYKFTSEGSKTKFANFRSKTWSSIRGN